MRRLIIIAVSEGEDPDLELEGKFHNYEVLAALQRVSERVENQLFEEDYASELDEGDDE